MTELRLFRGYHFPMEIYFETHRRGGFTQLSLDLSSRCNYSCDWCFNRHLLNGAEPDRLNLDEKVELIEQARELGAKTLVIPGTGEPTLDKDFYPLIARANKAGLITVVYSNLTGNVDANKIRTMFDSNVSIGIKLDSFDQTYFEKRYHATKKEFLKFLENLKHVTEIYKGSEQITDQGIVHRAIANMVLTRENLTELKSIARFCESNSLPLFVRPVKPIIWARQKPEKWREIGNQTGILSPEKDLTKLAFEYNSLFSPSSTSENHCAIYSFGLTVKNNGDVQLCPDHHDSRGAFGNVRKETLKNIIARLNLQRTIKPGFCVMLPETNHKLK